MAVTDANIEAARARIHRLVEEIAALSKAEMRSEDYFQKFLERVVEATDAKGGAVWLVQARTADKQPEFQLCAQVRFESSLFQSDENQRASLLRILNEVMAQKRPMVLRPDAMIAEGETREYINRTPYPFLQVPLLLKEQPLGVLQVWLQPYVQAQNYAEFVTFLGSLGAHVEQHLQSRRLGSLVLESQRLQHLLRFMSDISGSLDMLEVSRLTANYGRDIIGCERCTVLLLDRDRWRVMSISGQETVERKSAMVKAMTAFVEAHARPETAILSKKELLDRARAALEGVTEAGPEDVPAAPTPATPEGAPPVGAGPPAIAMERHPAVPAQGTLSPAVRRTDEIDLAYFQLSHVVSAAIAPMHNKEKHLVGAFFAESTFEGFFDRPAGATEPSAAQRMADWLATHSSRTLLAARDYQTLPLRRIGGKIRATKLILTSHRRRRFLMKWFLVLAILAGVSLWPAKIKVDGDCALMPIRRATVVPEIAGRVERVLVREGDRVKKGQPVAELDTTRLQTELQATMQEKLKYLAEADRYRGLNDEAGAQVALLQANVAAETEKKLKADITSAVLRAPIDGAVLTKNLEIRQGEYLQPGTIFTEIGGLEEWELQIEVNETDIQRVEDALAAQGRIDTQFILYSQTAHTYDATLTSMQQISAAAYPKQHQNVFIITLPQPEIPVTMRDQLRPGLTGRAKMELGRKAFALLMYEKIERWVKMRLIK